mgnify:CR=1 FL=1
MDNMFRRAAFLAALAVFALLAAFEALLYRATGATDLVLHKKHTIEVVVDRFKVREDLQLRLAESFETAITLTDGLALISPMDEDSALEEKLFSARYSCPYCDYSLQELEPRMFSFNNPNGACEACDGLGVSQYFGPEGGGFYRYSVDQYWQIPHFEKMLYDNGPLLSLYADAWQADKQRPLFKHVCERIAEWVRAEQA